MPNFPGEPYDVPPDLPGPDWDPDDEDVTCESS